MSPHTWVPREGLRLSARQPGGISHPWWLVLPLNVSLAVPLQCLAFLARESMSCPCLRCWILCLRSTMDCCVMLALLMPWDSKFLSSLDSCRKSRVDPQLRLLSRFSFWNLCSSFAPTHSFLLAPKRSCLALTMRLQNPLQQREKD